MTQTPIRPQTGRPAPLPAPGYHLVHRPDSLEGLMSGTTAAVPQEFGISVPLVVDHPVRNEGSRRHELHGPVETLRQGALFVAHRYFRVPAERPVVFAATELTVTEPDAWLRGPDGSGHLEMDLLLEPADVVGGVPRGLECRADLRIDGRDCGRATARLVFLMPKVYQNHRQRGRVLSRADVRQGPQVMARSDRPQPSEVGRVDPADVVIGHGGIDEDDTLTVQVLTEPGHPLHAGGATDHVPSAVLLEASRQTAFWHAASLGGFVPADCLLTEWAASFQGFAEPDLPLHCTSTAGPAERDGEGRPLRRFTLVLTQGARQVGVIRTSVLQHC
ncbi:AfsA-related hotdog domain-containing protein [Streptacidiphilus jiangxiensis]|uniref:A-factor biosynthesis hotdog domain-containing protein n=1 Tax=Streptacidiphilus jiangxiensis TaxID=235985 RepID=A0A1H7ICE6_STRJI|nr:AfsA-related hotdog domain-containing protein [Streptacidiphilus jiangxiensis]SEK59532.1 A-factor biosynthesis hotdog domain-containing protein [Streptacidiphilus jiangxiensis]